MSKRFRVAYVTEKGKLNDVPALEEHAEKVKYVLKGTEQDAEVIQAIYGTFSFTFDPDYDVIIPTGRTFVSFILGYFMRSVPPFYIGIYRDKQYKFMKVPQEF